jgi:hypothetical protein
MNILVMPDLLTDILEQEPIPPEKIAYLEARTRLRLHDFILRRLRIAEDGPDKLDRAKIARRLKLSRARVSQQLGAPGNWTVDSATRLAAAMGGEIDFTWTAFPRAERSGIGSAETIKSMTESTQHRGRSLSFADKVSGTNEKQQPQSLLMSATSRAQN